MASSYCAQHAVAAHIEKAIVQFGQEERDRLASQMPHREITLCEDETFHPQICLVAIEPVSNFLILEEYATKRDAPTWNTAVSEALKPYSITVNQCDSDMATALISHAESYLGVHHSPDLFHVQQDVSKATSAPLIRQTEKAEKTFSAADDSYLQVVKQLEDFKGTWPNSIEQLDLEQELHDKLPVLEEARNIARKAFETVQARQHRTRDARKGIGQDYHPYDLKTGAPVEAAQAQEKLNSHFDTLDQVASEAGLKPSSIARLAKAKRVLPSMIDTLVFFWKLIAIRAAALAYSPDIVDVWKNQLVASYYLAAAAGRCSDSKERKRLRELSSSILAQAKARDGPLSTLSEMEVLHLEEQARSAALHKSHGEAIHSGELAEWQVITEGRSAMLNQTAGGRDLTRIDAWVKSDVICSAERAELEPLLLELWADGSERFAKSSAEKRSSIGFVENTQQDSIYKNRERPSFDCYPNHVHLTDVPLQRDGTPPVEDKVPNDLLNDGKYFKA